jgi:hypothetical protein
MRNQAIESRGDGWVLRVEFVWRGDRFGQVISVVGADGVAAPLLESVEEANADGFPASPPLQSLSIETLADGRRAALLVGMAGRSHWSASIEPLADAAGLLFDIACRAGEPRPRLASEYAIAVERLNEAQGEVTDSGIELRFGDQTLVGRALLGTASATTPSEKSLTFAPIAAPATKLGATIRWRYEIRLLPSSA